MLTLDRIAALFNALAVHVYLICTSDTVIKGLAKTRAHVCMMGLASLQQSWPVGSWVLKLFNSIMARLKMAAQDPNTTKQARQFRPEKSLAAGADADLPRSQNITSNFDSCGQGLRQTENHTTPSAEHGLNFTNSNQSQAGIFASNLSQDPFLQFMEAPMAFNYEDMPNMFALDDSAGQLGLDQDNFFHGLDFASIGF